ncbi:MAG: hypothetical protein HC884_12825 [Chloroflexaceae bacterium]|nr:hypothetical protein [Chloroflexaceae bacterium]
MVRTRRLGILSGIVGIIILVGMLAFPAASALAQSVASIEGMPDSITPDTEVNLTFKGFAPNEKVDVWLTAPGTSATNYESTHHAIGTYTANGDGEFTQEMKIKSPNPNGTHILAARGQTSGLETSSTFAMQEAPAAREHEETRLQPAGGIVTMSASTSPDSPGSIWFSAADFAPKEPIGIWLTPLGQAGAEIELGHQKASEEGTFFYKFTPAGQYNVGIYYISAQGHESGTLAIGIFEIVGSE